MNASIAERRNDFQSLFHALLTDPSHTNKLLVTIKPILTNINQYYVIIKRIKWSISRNLTSYSLSPLVNILKNFMKAKN